MTIAPVEGWRFVAHAIVSREGFIADADGTMPPCLHVPEDQERFRAALASADVTILGRDGHERHPAQGRSRIVLTTRVTGVERRRENGGTVLYWNPSGAALAEALQPFGDMGTTVIAGGTRVMTTLLSVTDRFDLVVAPRCTITDGRPCLVGIRSIEDIERTLAANDLREKDRRRLGAADLRIWSRN